MNGRAVTIAAVVGATLAGTAAYATCRRRASGAASVDVGEAGPRATFPDCDEAHQTLYFHGKLRQGLEVVTKSVCAPRLEEEGDLGFWSDAAAAVRAPRARVLVGYSAGRIPVLRRLAGGAGAEQVVALLDPSWSDGPRFDGKSGPEIVERWLSADPARVFVLLYAPDAAGFTEYLAIREGKLASRILVCAVGAPHEAIPRAVGSSFVRDPRAWISATCPTGIYDPPAPPAPEEAAAPAIPPGPDERLQPAAAPPPEDEPATSSEP